MYLISTTNLILILVTNVGVPTTLGAARVIILLFIQNFIVPIVLLVLRQITLPYRILRFVQYLPVRGARFIVQLPLRIIKLPLNIVLAPLTALLFLARIAKRIVVNPFSRVYNFLTSVIAFAFGVPVKVFGRIYTH